MDKTTNKKPQFLSCQEASEELHCSVWTIYRLLKDGTLQGGRLKTKRVVSVISVERKKKEMMGGF